MTITVRQLAEAVNNLKRLDFVPDPDGMPTFEVTVFNQYMRILHREPHTCWYQEEAEKLARDRCVELDGFTWQVTRLN